MQFTVPQFIERKTKIVGPFSFEQFAFVLTAAGICFLLYFILPFALFLAIAVLLVGTSLALAFVKIQGVSLPVIIKNYFFFATNPKIYLWRKKTFIPKLIERRIEPIKKEEAKEKTLKIAEHSKLKDLSTQLETKSK